MAAIKITCTGADAVDYNKILNFQGELKELNEDDRNRLVNEILEYGFNSPIHVWRFNKKLYNLDGHQRVAVLNYLKSEGWTIPKIPVDYIKAKNLKEAKHILLSRVKQYGIVKAQGFYNYMADANMDINEVKESFGDLPGLDMEKFDKDFFQRPDERESEGATEISTETFSHLAHTCPKCGFKFGKGATKGKKA